MNHDARTPLDAEERSLADALTRLSALEPPPALDARVLAQAKAALAATPTLSHRRRHRPWWMMSAGLGTAAAAVLVAGVAWQAGIFDIEYGSSLPVPLDHPPAVQSAQPDQAEQAVPVVLDHVAAPTPAPPPQAEAAARKEAPPKPTPPAAAPALPPTPPAPPAAGASTPAQASQALRQSVPPVIPTQEKVAVPVAMPRERADMDDAAAASLDSVSVSGTVLPDAQAALPHWREDAKLEPDAWLDRIRERARRGDRPSAVRSLRLFEHQHPTRPIPSDLVRLQAG